jgi:hypothetical protein
MRFQELIDKQMTGCQQPHFHKFVVKIGDPKSSVEYSFEGRDLYPLDSVATVDCGGNLFIQTCTHIPGKDGPAAVWQGADGFPLESAKSRWHAVCGQVTVVTLVAFISTVPFNYFSKNITTAKSLVRVALATAVGLDPASVLTAQVTPTDMEQNSPTDVSGTQVKAKIEVKVSNTEWLMTKLDSPIFPALLGAQLRQAGIPVHDGEIKCQIDAGSTATAVAAKPLFSEGKEASSTTAPFPQEPNPRPLSSTSLALFGLWLTAILFYNNNSSSSSRSRRDHGDEDDEDDDSNNNFGIGKPPLAMKRNRRSYIDDRSVQGEMDSYDVLKRNASNHFAFKIGDASPKREANNRNLRGSPTPLLRPPPSRFSNDLPNVTRSAPVSRENSPQMTVHRPMGNIISTSLYDHQRRLSNPGRDSCSESEFVHSPLVHTAPAATRRVGSNHDGTACAMSWSQGNSIPPMKIAINNVIPAPNSTNPYAQAPAYLQPSGFKQRSHSDVEVGSSSHRTLPRGHQPDNHYPSDSIHSQSNC